MSAVCPGWWQSLVCKPCRPFSLGFGRGLSYHQLNVGHIESPAVKLLHKPQLPENLQSPLNRSYLVAGQCRYHLRCVGDMLVKLQFPAVFQRF